MPHSASLCPNPGESHHLTIASIRGGDNHAAGIDVSHCLTSCEVTVDIEPSVNLASELLQTPSFFNSSINIIVLVVEGMGTGSEGQPRISKLREKSIAMTVRWPASV